MSDQSALGFFKSLGKHPVGFWFIFWGELAERSSFYGMRAILALYMTEKLGFQPSESANAMAIFMGAAYYLPLIGGWVADNFLGKYWTIVAFSIPYIAGHLILGIEQVPFLVISLALLAMGTGVIKPNISTLMGLTYDQQRPGDASLRSDAFSIFYMAINLGAVASQWAMPYIRTTYSYQVAFAFPAALMVVAFLLFTVGKRKYAVEKVDRQRTISAEEAQSKRQINVLIAVVGLIFAGVLWASVAKSPLLTVVGIVGFIAFAVTVSRVLGRLGTMFAIVTFFWAIFDQSSSTWIFFAKSDFNLDVFGFHVEPDAIQALNSAMIVLFVPLFSIVWRVAATARGKELRATDKMQLGFILTASTMAVMAIAGFFALGGVKVNIAFQVGAYVLLTCAEICISIVGLELAYVAAPLHQKSVVTACWLCTVSIGNLCINAPITSLYDTMPPAWYFSMLTATMVPVILVFAFVARAFNQQEMQKTKPSADPVAPEGAMPAQS